MSNLQANANARRQAAFKARWTAAGWKRKTLWVNVDDYAAGERIGRRNGSPTLPASVDPASWLLGYAAGLAPAAGIDREKP